MPVNFRGSKTEQQLINAFAGESMARNRYLMYASTAKKEGYEQIAEIFEITANNEYEHAKLFYKHIGYTPKGHVDSFYPFEFGSTEENLLSSINAETEEFTLLYPNAEKIALDEGFDSAASTFKHIINSEKHHAQRFQRLYEELKNGTLFDKDESKEWICRECGFIHQGNSAPDYCPNCHHKKAYFQILCEKY
ncbi:rubrerythrin family protein [bacterium]|nr:rubrerythrin family protein [bacterium]